VSVGSDKADLKKKVHPPLLDKKSEKFKILVVDDKKENIMAAKQFFDSLGKFSVDYVTNLEDAKKKLESGNYVLGIFDLDLPVKEGGDVAERAGLELGKIAREKENMFYVYYSGGFFHRTPRTKVFTSEKDVLENKADVLIEDTYSKDSPQGWKELYEKLVNAGKPTPEKREKMKESLKRYYRVTGLRPPALPKIPDKGALPYIIDIIAEIADEL